MKKTSWWTARESVLVLLFLVGAVVIVTMARAYGVGAASQAVYVFLFALASLLIWSMGRIRSYRAHKRGNVDAAWPFK
ncbi:hypothetical protein R70006_06183 [Paraburkholderia domus]|uniref:hypothetical protein n=1 Tax=Paraburkholderia domus TaxID=2793075 RepID=UPI001912F025|nr:hypothetical protein [Paraburkholderia domus]MBK5052817.1 hypothetical protein [Burkholderia sp. R-70006]CAE6820706.1 hypothetical protein R70006_06183 [Paraburkholderia domus]